jgi:hypothetical protein
LSECPAELCLFKIYRKQKGLRGRDREAVMLQTKEVKELLLRARDSWETLRDFQSGKCVEDSELKKAVVELRDSLLRVSHLVLPSLVAMGFKSDQLTVFLNISNSIRATLDFYLACLELSLEESSRRAALAICLASAPPIETWLTFLEKMSH